MKNKITRERCICEKQNNNLLSLILTLKRQCVEIALEFQRSSFIIEYKKKQTIYTKPLLLLKNNNKSNNNNKYNNSQ